MTSELVLASASAARAQLLASAGLDVRVEPATVDEWSVKQTLRTETRAAADCALALAESKAAKVAERHRRAVVIGADQILVCGGEWFDKPADLREARAQLQRLRGRTHELVTAICVVQARMRLWHTVNRPQLTMRQFSDDFLDDYIAAEGEVLLGCVGAYRLEGRGVQLFDRTEGDHFAIRGLPLLELLSFLRARGHIPS